VGFDGPDEEVTHEARTVSGTVTGDDIGSRGEAIFYVLMTDWYNRKRPLFRSHFLGEKFATLDYLVELVGARKAPAYFFVQVKSTRQGCTTRTNQPRLKVSVSARDIRRMVAYPGPTYVVGIDEPNGAGYIVAVRGTMNRGLATLPARYPLTFDNLQRLWAEVKQYWSDRDMRQHTSVFSIEGTPR
jgi:hypothetical protein